MRNEKLTAVVNEDLLLVHKGFLAYPTIEMFHSDIEKIAEAITERITNDQRFVDAVGKKVAKNARFDVLPLCHECEDCGEKVFFMRVVMFVGNYETDFVYDYSLVMGPFNDEPTDSPYVLYSNDSKSQLMQVYESVCSGVTSVKTLKNGRGADGSDDYLERIYTEIMAEGDLKIF